MSVMNKTVLDLGEIDQVKSKAVQSEKCGTHCIYPPLQLKQYLLKLHGNHFLYHLAKKK